MAKYIGTYASSGDVQTALDNLELSRPFIAYTTDDDKVIFGANADRAEVGDIVVYSTGDTLLHYIKQADYSASTYPTAAYIPVGVVAYPEQDTIFGPTGEITFMGLNWLDMNNPDTGNVNSTGNIWGSDSVDIPELTNYADSGTAITDMNGKANTQVVLQYATAQTDWRTASVISWENRAGYFPLFECAWRYHTPGTVQGDWYIPACGQLYLIQKSNDILNMFNSGLTLISANTFTFDNNRYSTSTESTAAFQAFGWDKDKWDKLAKYSSSYNCSKPFCSKLMTRI